MQKVIILRLTSNGHTYELQELNSLLDRGYKVVSVTTTQSIQGDIGIAVVVVIEFYES